MGFFLNICQYSGKHQIFLMTKILIISIVCHYAIQEIFGQVSFVFKLQLDTIYSQQIRVRKLSFHNSENERFIKYSFDPENETFLGAYSCEVFETIPVLLIRHIIENDEHKYYDNEINYCRFFKKQRVNFMISYFQMHFVKYLPMKGFTCPFLPGKYLIAEARPKVTSADDFMPSFIPRGGRFTIRASTETIIAKKRVRLSNSTEIFEFYWFLNTNDDPAKIAAPWIVEFFGGNKVFGFQSILHRKF